MSYNSETDSKEMVLCADLALIPSQYSPQVSHALEIIKTKYIFNVLYKGQRNVPHLHIGPSIVTIIV